MTTEYAYLVKPKFVPPPPLLLVRGAGFPPPCKGEVAEGPVGVVDKQPKWLQIVA